MARMVDTITIGPSQLTSSNVTEAEREYSATIAWRKDEQAYSNTTRRIYRSLDDNLTFSGVTFTSGGMPIGTQVNWNNHGLNNDSAVTFSTTGTLPTGMVAGTIYYVISATSNQFYISATPGGSRLSFTGVGSGTHSVIYGGNVGNAATDTDHWQDIGPMNRWAMFDDSTITKSRRSGGMTVIIVTASRVDSVALTGLVNATSVTIVAANGGTQRYNETFDLDDDAFDEVWETPAFTRHAYKHAFARTDIPPYNAMQFTITITGSGVVEVGGLFLGLSTDIGAAEYKSRSGIKDYSIKETDEFGGILLTERGYSQRGDFTVFVASGRANGLQALFAENRARPKLWLMAPDDGGNWQPRGIIYGIWTNFEFSFEGKEHDRCQLTLEGFV